MYIIDINDLTEKEIIKVMDKNHKSSVLQKEEIKKLEKINKQEKTQIITPVLSKTLEQKDINLKCEMQNNDNEFEDEVSYYLTEIDNIKEDEINQKLKKALPTKKNYNYTKILLRLKAEMLKNIKEIKELCEEEKETTTAKDLEEMKEYIMSYKEKINIIDNALIEKEEIIEDTETIENNIFYASTSSGNIRVLEEIDKIPIEYYERFLGLLNSIKEGTFKNVKRFTTINNSTYGLCEVRDFKTRVIFDRIGENDYVVVTMFIKKCDNDKGYIEPLKRKITEYKLYSDDIKEKLNDEEFISTQKNIDEEIINKLSEPIQKTKKRGTLK